MHSCVNRIARRDGGCQSGDGIQFREDSKFLSGAPAGRAFFESRSARILYTTRRLLDKLLRRQAPL